MVTTTKRTTHAWMIALVAVAMALALMLGIGLVDPHGSAATTAAAGSGQPSARRPDTTCALAWRVVSSPPGNSGSLEAVAAVSTDDAWAVGYECLADDCDSHTVLTMHWDGATWSIVPSPNGGILGELHGVAAISTDDVWAVGGSDNGALTMHWDGSNWTVVPNPGPSTSSLSAVAAVAADDVWAVGRSPSGALTMHWSGTSWSAVPNLSIHGALFAVAVVAANDVWAVGTHNEVSYRYRTLAMHWNGTSWSVVDITPDPSLYGSYLNGVAAVAANDVWAVGTYYYSAEWKMLTMHWDGTSWSVVSSPNPGTRNNTLHAVAAVTAQEVWAVGYGFSGNGAVTMQWDGTSWTLVPNPPDWGDLRGVAVVAANDVWAVGTGGSDGSATLTMRYSEDCPVGTPTPTSTRTAVPPTGTAVPPTSTSVLPTSTRTPGPPTTTGTAVPPTGPPMPSTTTRTPTSTATRTLVPPTSTYVPPTTTRTPVPPTGTPVSLTSTGVPSTSTRTAVPASATVTPCPIRFTDVDETHAFYLWIRCLACRGIVAGYADGSFRPFTSLTRGQAAKFVANAAALTPPIASSQQTFADVPNSNPFWLWIERLAGVGALSGYTCGGPGEPCDPQNRPYFRWGTGVTRSQLAKIVAITAGFTDDPATQTFADVPPSHPFYRWVEQVAARGIISGYPCGGPGEPCDGQQRPYFRPFNSATRGQTAKIVANTFFPGCVTP